MLKYIFKRLLYLFPVLIGVSVLSFLVISFIPGDAVDILLGPESGSPEQIAEMKAHFMLDKPIHTRYVMWLWNVVNGDLGRSFSTGRTVEAEIKTSFPVTLQLTIASLFVAICVGVPFGIVSAVRRNSLSDSSVRLFALGGLSMPNFWLGIILILFASLYIKWFPPQGRILFFQEPWACAKQLFFPAVTLGIAVASMLMRMTRSCILEVLNQDYMRTARSKGLHERKVIYKHALKNAFIPVVTLIGLQFGYILGGTIVTEEIFSLPGMGSLIFRSINMRDYFVVQGILLFAAFNIIVINLITDIAVYYLDPRIRYE